MLTAPSQAPHPIRARKLVNHRGRRWDRVEMTYMGLITGSFVFSLVMPATVVSPMKPVASVPMVLTAVILTLVGVAGALTAGWLAFRRTQLWGWLIATWLPAFGVVAGAAVLAGTKMY